MDYKYRAFISYRHISPDQEIAKKLHTLLETYRVPANIRKKGIHSVGKIFRDNEELPISPNLSRNIENALDSSEWFIAVCSPQYQQSKWCMREIEYFISRYGRDRVLAVIVGGESDSCFPDILRFVPDENGALIEKKPLAADVRGDSFYTHKKKLRKEKLRLLAPILQTGFDDLYQRQRRRKINTLLGGTSAAAVILGSFLVYALIQNARLDAAHRIAAQNECDLLIEKSILYTEENRRTEAAELAREAGTVSEEIGGYASDRIENALAGALTRGDFIAETALNIPGIYGYGFCFSPDDRYLAAVISQNSVACYDAITGEQIWISQPLSHRLSSLCWSGNGKVLALTSTLGQQAVLLDAANGNLLYQADIPYISDLIEHDDEWLAVYRNGVLSWNPDTGERNSFIYEENAGAIIRWSCSSDRTVVAWSSAPFGSTVYIADTKKETIYTVELEGMKVTNGFALSPDGSELFVFQFDCMKAIDLQSGFILWENTLENGIFPAGEDQMLWMNDKIIANDLVIDAKKGAILYTLNSAFHTFSSDGRFLLCTDGLYRVEDGTLFCRIPGTLLAADHAGQYLLILPENSQITMKACMPGEGSQYAIPDYTGTLFTVPPGALPSSGEGSMITLTDDYQESTAMQTGLVSSLQISPDGRFVLLINDGTTIKVWNLEKGENVVYRIYDFSTAGYTDVAAVAFSSDSKLTAIAGGRGNAGVYDLESGRLLHSWQDYWNKSSLSGICFDRNGNSIMFANYQKTEFQVCSVENGLILYTMHADRAVKSWGFDEESGDAVIVYEDGSALAAQIF